MDEKIIINFFYVSFTSCGIQKTKISEQQRIANLIDSLNYKVNLPENWQPTLDSHGLLCYSPKNLNDQYYKNVIYIYIRIIKEDENASLKAFVDEIFNQSNPKMSHINQYIRSEPTKYGETFFTLVSIIGILHVTLKHQLILK